MTNIQLSHPNHREVILYAGLIFVTITRFSLGQHSPGINIFQIFYVFFQIVNIAFWNEIGQWKVNLKSIETNFAFSAFLSLTKL